MARHRTNGKIIKSLQRSNGNVEPEYIVRRVESCVAA